FAVISSGGAVGAVAGAGAAALALSLIPVGALLLAASALFLATAIFLALFASTGDPSRHALDGDAPRSSLAASNANRPLHTIVRHPYLRRMALLTVLSTAALLITDYVFKSVMAQRLSGAALGVGLARSYALFNAVSLAVQVLVAGRILRTAGV